MCYFTEVPDWTELDKLMDYAIRTDEWNEYFHVVNGFSNTAKLPVVTSEMPRNIQAFNWGLIPQWCKTNAEIAKMKAFTLNARNDTIFEKKSFKNLIGKKRCLIFIKGFYEWHTIGKAKYPYYIFMKDHQIFSLAGIYDSWVDTETGEIHNNCSMITTEANPLMAKIHNEAKRMPVIVGNENREKWLLSDLTKEEINSMMIPYHEDKMDAYTISKLVNSRTENPNQEKVKERVEYPELSMFD